jgi:hypothetical protein
MGGTVYFRWAITRDIRRFTLEKTLTLPDRPQLSTDHRSPATLRGLARIAFERKAALGVFVLFWLIAVIGGWFLLERHANRPGDLSAPPLKWPTESRLDRPANRSTLLLFAHPHCPCTRATLSELERFLARNPDSQQTTIVFIKPPGTPAGWEDTDTLHRAKAIPGVKSVVDVDGVEARRFHAVTSGVAMYYDADGRLAFYGGLTPARGHEGGSDGVAALQAIVSGNRPAIDHANVFGCPLGTPANEPCTVKSCTGDGACREKP